MNWEHFRIEKQGTCGVQNVRSKEIISVPYQMGTIATGKQRVYWGHQLVLQFPEFVIAAKVKGGVGSYQEVLQDCNTQLHAIGLRLLVAGNAPSYNESAMSGVGGFGYIGGRRDAFHLMSPLPEQQNQQVAGESPDNGMATT